jgi:hypothetical protein
LNLNYSSSEEFEDGKMTATKDTFDKNIFLNIDKSITPLLFYKLNVRANLSDSDVTDSEGMFTTTYKRTVSPAIDVFLSNPMYSLDAGYRRSEQWSTAHLSEDSRNTTELHYSRFNITPYLLPSLSLQFDRQRDYDHLSVMKKDRTNTTYSVNSTYELPSSDLKLRYNITYERNMAEIPTSITSKAINDNFNGVYDIGYSRSFWVNKAILSAGYQGNYSRNKNQQFVGQTGKIFFKRIPFGGFYALGTLSEPDVDELTSEVFLANSDFSTEITKINIDLLKFHNIGIQVSSEKPVDSLYIYVNKNVSSDTKLTISGNWKVFRSNFNQPDTWTEIVIQSVQVDAFDVLNNIYRYKIMFLSPQNASFFKAVNLETVNATGITDVFVTEIEAYGTDVVPHTGIITDISILFKQGLNLRTQFKPFTKLNISLKYNIDKTDQGTVSPLDSIEGLFAKILNKSANDDTGNLRSDITRSYGAAATWMTHRLLTTTLSIHRNETFDNKKETDDSTNNYSLSFGSTPLPTLDINLSLIKRDKYSFEAEESTGKSVLLSISSKLYTDVNMVTDMEYSSSKNIINKTDSSTYTINGSLYAILTRKLSTDFRYGFNSKTSSGGRASRSKNGSTIITYWPGRFINVSGTLDVTDTDGNLTTTEEFLIDWLPLPAIRLNFNYRNIHSEPGPSISNSFSIFGTWRVTKSINVQFTYSFTKKTEEQETAENNFSVNLSSRF